MTPATPTPMPISALPEMIGCMVSPAPAVPKFSRVSPCFLKMPASWPSVGIWFSQLLIWPMATLNPSSARAADATPVSGATIAKAQTQTARDQVVALFRCMTVLLSVLPDHPRPRRGRVALRLAAERATGRDFDLVGAG